MKYVPYILRRKMNIYSRIYMSLSARYYSNTYSNKLKKFIVFQEDNDGFIDIYYEDKICRDLLTNGIYGTYVVS